MNSLSKEVKGLRNIEVRVSGLGGCEALRRRLGVAEKSDRQVFDVSGPLGGQLKELNVIPLNAIDRHWKDTKHTNSADKHIEE